MKKHLQNSFLGLGLFVFAGVAGCSPSASQLRKTIEENPDIVFSAIEKDPKKFFEVVRAAQEKAQSGGQDDRIQAEVKRVLEEVKTPKKPYIDSARVVGKADAPITIVEYSDYNCGHCSTAHETVEKIKAKYGDKVRFVFKNYPVLDQGTGTSKMAAEYAEALGLQGVDKMYAFHSAVFENQGSFQERKEAFLKDTLKEVASKTGADLGKAEKDRKSAAVKTIIDSDMKEASEFGFQGTPAFLVNGASLPGAYPPEAFFQIIDAILAGQS